MTTPFPFVLVSSLSAASVASPAADAPSLPVAPVSSPSADPVSFPADADAEEGFLRHLRRAYAQHFQPRADLLPADLQPASPPPAEPSPIDVPPVIIAPPACRPVSPLRRRANWHRRMAMACLRADSSRAVRLGRYRAHIAKARALEAQSLAIRAPASGLRMAMPGGLRMAMAGLHADFSRAVCLNRFRAHIAQARALEARSLAASAPANSPREDA